MYISDSERGLLAQFLASTPKDEEKAIVRTMAFSSSFLNLIVP